MTVREFGILIREITANANQYVGAQAAEYGIKYGQFEYFLLIFNEPGINQLELARKKGVGKASVTKALKKLEEQGFINRTVDAEDKRNLRCYVTEKGAAIADELIGLSAHIETDIFAGFSEEEKEQFYSYLQRLLNNTRRMADSVQPLPEE
jgi:DNA-binding MarR family transcriptional regulator